MRILIIGIGGVPGLLMLSGLAHAQAFDLRFLGVICGVLVYQGGQAVAEVIYDRLRQERQQ